MSLLMKAILEKACCVICLGIVLSPSCSSKTLDVVNSDQSTRNDNEAAVRDDKLYYLDLKQPTIVQPIESTSESVAKHKFVQVEVTQVVNPKKHPVSFQVFYQTSSNERIFLGSFGLYPSDNPGKFIVATQGKLKGEGAIVLSLEIPENVDAGDTLKVGVKKLRLVND